jgi:hypothetical protein
MPEMQEPVNFADIHYRANKGGKREFKLFHMQLVELQFVFNKQVAFWSSLPLEQWTRDKG